MVGLIRSLELFFGNPYVPLIFPTILFLKNIHLPRKIYNSNVLFFASQILYKKTVIIFFNLSVDIRNKNN